MGGSMSRDTLGTLRARLEIVKKAHASLWTDMDRWKQRAEAAEAALREIVEMERRLPNCITTEAKLLRRAIAAARAVVEGQPK